MKPEEAAERIGRWGVNTTRRTVLTYEKDKLAPPPYIETGKHKEYPETFTAEFIASWCLIHGDYGLKPKMVTEVRKKAYDIIYGYQKIWKSEITGLNDIDSLHDLVKKGTNWRKSCDFFVFAWIMTRMAIIEHNNISEDVDEYGNVNWSQLEVIEGSILRFIQSGNFKDIPKLNIYSYYNVSSKRIFHRGVNISCFTKGRGSIVIELTNTESEFHSPSDVVDAYDFGCVNVRAGYQNVINISYIHPEDLVLSSPVY